MEQRSIDIVFAALCCWREARGCSDAERLAQLCVIRNRVHAGWLGDYTYQDAVCHPWQFSGLTAKGDANLVKFPKSEDRHWIRILELAEEVVSGRAVDPTGGAVFYFSKPLTAPPAAWGNVKHCVDVGELHFYR
jgi:N-acetylmuramoyl-L-alanine amidase